MTLEETLGALLDARMLSVLGELRRLAGEVQALRRDIPPMLVTVSEAAGRLGVSVSTVKRRVKDGTIPVQRVGRGRALRIDLTALHKPSSEDVAHYALALKVVD